MRWHILKTLLHKELLRHAANRGGIALALLLVVAALLLSLFGKDESPASALTGGVYYCFVDYWDDGPWVQHLRGHVPPEMQRQVKFRHVSGVPTQDGRIVYPPGTGAIQMRTAGRDERGPRYKVCFWHPGKDGFGLAPFEAWFWRESHHFVQQQAAVDSEHRDVVEEERSQLEGGLDARSGVATALVLFGLFFVCVYLLPSLTCEERERGVLLAQALSPASPLEILAAKFLFYPVLGVALAALLAGIYSPAVLARPFFWLALAAAVVGSLGIGLTISSLAKTQRSASMGALCYMMAVAMLLFICQQANVPGLPYLALEYHCPRMLYAALAGAVRWYHWGHLAGAVVLALGWAGAAVWLFRQRGWQ
jgi:hypothetical protein